jgi:hypothetical protein
LDTAAALRYLADGRVFVDVRPLAHFAAGHVPGALSIPLRPVFATGLGWLAPSDRPIVIIRDNEQGLSEIVWQPRSAATTSSGNSPAASTPGRAPDTRSRVPGWCDPIRSTAWLGTN